MNPLWDAVAFAGAKGIHLVIALASLQLRGAVSLQQSLKGKFHATAAFSFRDFGDPMELEHLLLTLL